MYSNRKLVILDADGTTIDAFQAIAETFNRHDMKLGDLSRFQKRHNLFKYLGGVKEFPKNLRKQLTRVERSKLIETLTVVYREKAVLYPGMQKMMQQLIASEEIIVGVVTRNITTSPIKTLGRLFERENIDVKKLDFLEHIPLREKKTDAFRRLRVEYKVNPALCYVCGDEYKDYLSAVSTGMHPFIVSYGFESLERLTEKYEIPREIISETPESMVNRLFHSLSMTEA